jgi:hypothetical protein
MATLTDKIGGMIADFKKRQKENRINDILQNYISHEYRELAPKELLELTGIAAERGNVRALRAIKQAACYTNYGSVIKMSARALADVEYGPKMKDTVEDMVKTETGTGKPDVDTYELNLLINYATSIHNSEALAELKKAAIIAGDVSLMEMASKGMDKVPSRLDYFMTLEAAVKFAEKGYTINDANTSVGRCYQKIFGDGYTKWAGEKTTMRKETVEGKEVEVPHTEAITYEQVPMRDRDQIHKMIADNILTNPDVYNRIESQLKAEIELLKKREEDIQERSYGWIGSEPRDEMDKITQYNRLLLTTMGIMDGSLIKEANMMYEAQQQKKQEKAKLHETVMNMWKAYEADGARMEEEAMKMNQAPGSTADALARTDYDLADISLGNVLQGLEGNFEKASQQQMDGNYGQIPQLQTTKKDERFFVLNYVPDLKDLAGSDRAIRLMRKPDGLGELMFDYNPNRMKYNQ